MKVTLIDQKNKNVSLSIFVVGDNFVIEVNRVEVDGESITHDTETAVVSKEDMVDVVMMLAPVYVQESLKGWLLSVGA